MGRSPTLKQSLFAAAMAGPAKGNTTRAARMAGYGGDRNVLAVIGWQNMRKPEIRKLIDGHLEGLVQHSLQRVAESLDAEKRHVFLTKTGEIKYSEPEPNHPVRSATAFGILKLSERLLDYGDHGDKADDGGPQSGDTAEVVKNIGTLTRIDRALIARVSQIDEKDAELERQLSEDADGPERPHED